MISIDRETYKRYKTGQMTLDKLTEYLIRNFSIYDIAHSLAETIDYEEPKPIVLTKEEFEAHFRIRGIKPDGTPELRGRRTKDSQPF